MFNCTLELDQRSYIWLEANEKSDVNTKLKYFAKSVLWDDASPIFFNISRPEPVYANALDVCVWIEKNPSIFETFNRLKRSNWREATQKATCLEEANGKEPTKDKHHKSLIFPRFLIRMKKYLCFTFRKEGNGKQTLYFIMPSSRNLFAKKKVYIWCRSFKNKYMALEKLKL